MNSELDESLPFAPPPRIRLVPDPLGSTELGDLGLRLCEAVGLGLDPWQQWILRTACAEESPGKWSAFEVGLMISRQNGKTALLEARELIGLFVLRESLIIHSAHLGDTARNSYNRLKARIASNSTLQAEILRAPAGRGSEAIELKDGPTVQFRTRTSGGGLGFSADCVIFDEDMDLPTTFIGTLMPTLSAMPNPQLWYAGSAVDQERHPDGVAKARIRDRALRGEPRLFYAEWSIPGTLTDITPAIASDPASWEQANPALGIRISPSYVGDEQRSMPARDFAVMRLGVGDWPATTDDANKLIPPADWRTCAAPGSAITGKWALALDVSPKRVGCLARCGFTKDKKPHVEILEHRRGESPSSWMVDRVVELAKGDSGPSVVILDGIGPVGSLLPQLEKHDRDIRLTQIGARELGQACGMFFDAILEHSVTHSDTAPLNAAVDGAARRSLGEAWAWDRKNSTVDISPLVAGTLAHMAARGLDRGVGVASYAEWVRNLTPETIAEKRRKSEERVKEILARHQR